MAAPAAGDRRATPLLDLHRSLGARLVDFAGWEMPLQYEGVIAEHLAVRNDAGLFDVSHLGKLRVSGPSAGAALQEALTADVFALEPGRATYALVLTDKGGCVDDVFVYRLSGEDFLVVPNAANVEAVAGALAASGCVPEDHWDRYAILALQGPRAFEVFGTAFPHTGADRLGLHAFATFELAGADCLVARTGYTGERGFELYVPFGAAAAIFEALVAAGARPCGLGARDTLRLEMGYALYGHELSLDINPLEARLGWAIAWDTPFRGRRALLEVKERGPARLLHGIRLVEPGVPRQGFAVLRQGEVVGRVTSGNHSPVLGCGIALALIESAAGIGVGDRVQIEARGRHLAGDIVTVPFIRRHSKGSE
jgi:aminomethyltransferase